MNLKNEEYQELRNRPDLQQIVPLIEIKSSVLDLGCGSGDLLKYLKDNKSITAHGVEISEEGMRQCIAKGIPVYQGDLDKGLRDYQDKRFDYVILSQTLQQVRNPLLVIKEMLRVGKKGIVSIPNFGYWLVRLSLLFSGKMPRSKDLPYEWYDTPNIHLATLKDIFDLCKDNRITIEKHIFLSASGSASALCAGLMPNVFATQGIFVISSEGGPDY